MTANIEGHACQILTFDEAWVPNFKGIPEGALEKLILKRDDGTYAFRNGDELWVKERGKVSIINFEVNETAVGTLYDGYLFRELMIEFSLKTSLWKFYEEKGPDTEASYRHRQEEALVRNELHRNSLIKLYDGRASTFSDN